MAINRKSRKALKIGYLWVTSIKIKSKSKSKGKADKDLRFSVRRELIRKLENKLTKSSRRELTFEKLKKLESLIIPLQGSSITLLNKQIVQNSVKYDFNCLIQEIDSVIKMDAKKLRDKKNRRSKKHLNWILKKIKPYPNLLDAQRFRDKYDKLSDFSKRRVRITVEEWDTITFAEIDRLVDSLLKNYPEVR